MEEKKSVEFCAITEQGDLGLGAFVLEEADQKIMEAATAKEKK